MLYQCQLMYDYILAMLINLFVKIFSVNYYCDMEVELIDIKTEHVILQDNSEFFYTVKPYELTNALGNIIAVLQEYNFTKKDDNNEDFSCKLYKTKEGNWYDIEETKMDTEKVVLRMLKSAIDAKKIIQF